MYNQEKKTYPINIYLWNCLKIVPLPVISLFIYMALKSTAIFPDYISEQPWHSAYLGWYDFILAASIAYSIISGAIKVDKGSFLFLLTLAIIIVLSFFSAFELGVAYIIDSLVYLLRFSLTFSLAKGMVHRLGTKATESLLFFLFILLAISSLFVLNLRFSEFARVYAAAMTVASFSQVSAVVCFTAFIRKYRIILLISSIFLLLTFSRTTTIISLVLFVIYARKTRINQQIKYYLLGGIFICIFFSILLHFGGEEFASVITDRTNTESFSNLNDRSVIWAQAGVVWENGYIPIFGVGFDATPNLIIEHTDLKFPASSEDELTLVSIPHFHSIFIEYFFGLGILSTFIFFYLFKRIWQTFYHHCYPSFFIFAFFVMTQAIDFTFYQPKEVIIWSFMLGLAEGQWRFENG